MKLFWMINYIIQASFVPILHNAAKIALPISKSGLSGNTAHIKARTGAFRRDLEKLCKNHAVISSIATNLHSKMDI